MSYEISKEFKFEAAHQLLHHDGKCARPHGHSYVFELFVESSRLRVSGPAAGMVDDYAALSEVGKWIEDMFDHRDLNEVLDSDTTTGESLCGIIFDLALTRLPNLCEVRVKETAKTSASIRPSRMATQRAAAIAEQWMQEQRDRLYENIDTSDPYACWIFQGAKDVGGYGWFSLAPAHTKKAHRASLWLAGEEIDDLIVMHACGTPSCVNPNHLIAGTHADNENDKDRKVRRPIGEQHGRSKLTREDVVGILDQIACGVPRRTIAAQYNVSTALINAIHSNRVWKEVPRA